MGCLARGTALLPFRYTFPSFSFSIDQLFGKNLPPPSSRLSRYRRLNRYPKYSRLRLFSSPRRYRSLSSLRRRHRPSHLSRFNRGSRLRRRSRLNSCLYPLSSLSSLPSRPSRLRRRSRLPSRPNRPSRLRGGQLSFSPLSPQFHVCPCAGNSKANFFQLSLESLPVEFPNGAQMRYVCFRYFMLSLYLIYSARVLAS